MSSASVVKSVVKASEETVINLATDSSVRLNLSLDFLYEPYLINPSFLFPCSPHTLAFQILLFLTKKPKPDPKRDQKPNKNPDWQRNFLRMKEKREKPTHLRFSAASRIYYSLTF